MPLGRSLIEEQGRQSTVARKTIGERLAQLEAQRKTLQIRLSKQERAIDTRRKVLIGALVLHRLENDRDVHFAGGIAEWLRSGTAKIPHPRRRPGSVRRSAEAAGK